MAPTRTKIIEMRGLHYHPRSKALHIRVEDPEALSDITIFLRKIATKRAGHGHAFPQQEESSVLDCQFLHLALRDTFLTEHEHQDQPFGGHVPRTPTMFTQFVRRHDR